MKLLKIVVKEYLDVSFQYKSVFRFSINVKSCVFQFVTIINGCEKMFRCVFSHMNVFLRLKYVSVIYNKILM